MYTHPPGSQSVTKKLVDIDDDVLREASRVLGAPTMKATVNQALVEVVRLANRRAHAERLATMRDLDLADDDVMTQAWR